MLTLPIASRAYEIGTYLGELAAVLVFGALALALARRALRSRRVAARAPAPASPSTAPALATSVGPPAWQAPPQPASALAQPSRVVRSPWHWRTDVIVACVCGALSVAALVRYVDHRMEGPWDSRHAQELRAGFLAGCGPTEPLRSSCECLFDELTSRPAYDTPAKFATLAGPIEAATRTGDPRVLPLEVQQAIASCRAARTS